MTRLSIVFYGVSPFQRLVYCATRPQLIWVLWSPLTSIITSPNAHYGFINFQVSTMIGPSKKRQ
jgi:hypothetical protein